MLDVSFRDMVCVKGVEVSHPSRSAKDLRTKRADLITSSIRFENLVKRFDGNIKSKPEKSTLRIIECSI